MLFDMLKDVCSSLYSYSLSNVSSESSHLTENRSCSASIFNSNVHKSRGLTFKFCLCGILKCLCQNYVFRGKKY
jgi:hypothetical protein